MVGDKRVRFCSHCKLNVYNFSEMASGEIQQLIEECTGRLCGRFYQRADGTMLRRDCPVGFRTAMLQTSRAAVSVLAALVSIAPAIAKPRQRQQSTPRTQRAEQPFTVDVIDATGAAIPNAAVTLVNGRTADRLYSSTGSDG